MRVDYRQAALDDTPRKFLKTQKTIRNTRKTRNILGFQGFLGIPGLSDIIRGFVHRCGQAIKIIFSCRNFKSKIKRLFAHRKQATNTSI